MREFNYLEFIEKLESSLKLGQHKQVMLALKQLNISRIPREYRLELAQLAYRAGNAERSLQIIHKIIHPEAAGEEPATDLELSEYAASLIKVGASMEALKFLDRIDTDKVNRAHLFRAFAHITQWQYDRAIEPLEAFIVKCKPEDYMRLVAQVNLAASFVQTNQYERAGELLHFLVKQTTEKNHSLLLANCRELQGQVAIATSQLNQAKKHLDQSVEILKAEGSLDRLFVDKWKTVLKIKLGKINKDHLDPLIKFRKKALQAKHYETLREVDFYLSQILQCEDKFLQVYFSTGSASYRQSLLKRCDFSVDIPNKYIVGAQERVLDLKDLVGLKSGSLPERLLLVLSSDLYRPFRLGSLFSWIYPDDFYDPFSTKDRVKQIIKRLRQYIETNKLGLTINNTGSAYQLSLNKNWGLLKTQRQEVKNSFEQYRDRMAEHFAKSEFSAQQAAKVLGVSQRQINKIIEQDQGQTMDRIGSGPSTRYVFKKGA